MTTRHHYQDKLDAIKAEVFQMGMLVRAALENAIKALSNLDKTSANAIIREDEKINHQEMLIEKQCAVLIATEQPVAGDLRFLISTLKTIRDLERIGDYAAHLAKTTLHSLDNCLHIPADIPDMTELCLKMLEDTLEAFLTQDIKKAESVINSDEDVDKKYLHLVGELAMVMKQDPDHINNMTPLVLVAKYLERLADHITSICSEIIYIGTGHRTEEEDEEQSTSK